MTSYEAMRDPAIRTAAENAVTPGDHYTLATYFEDAAREMQAKAEEQKALLERYEKMRFYGWQSHNLKSRTLALMRKYEQAAQSNTQHAYTQRQKARNLKIVTSGTIVGEAVRPFEGPGSPLPIPLPDH
jgi:hypothetical protein